MTNEIPSSHKKDLRPRDNKLRNAGDRYYFLQKQRSRELFCSKEGKKKQSKTMR